MPGSQYHNILQLTSEHLPDSDRWRCLGLFAHDLGWRPSDRLDEPLTEDLATVHLLVEHGLENTAVLSFLRRSKIFPEINSDEQQRLLSLSYNNLVDWHVVIEAEAVNYVYVRTRVPTIVERHKLSRTDLGRVRSEIFEQIIERRPNPNVPGLDDALIRTISYWKRNLAAEMSYSVRNDQLSTLFNSIMFVRALEDQKSRQERGRRSPLLLDLFDEASRSLQEILKLAFQRLVGSRQPAHLIDSKKLGAFDDLPRELSRSLLSDFYINKFAPYPYDFCVMSKHALSRIYEHYVSILKEEETAQLSLLPVLPQEHVDKSTGAIYTPHFIARFFARFLRDQIPPTAFRRLTSADPACGSGMFLRTLLELQGETLQATLNPSFGSLFQGVLGLDIDPNAVEAAKLSLALLYLALTGEPPKELNVVQGDAISYLNDNALARGAYDAVLANPPFVSLDTQSEETRRRLAAYLGDKPGRADMYLAFLRLGLEMLKPGGYGLFVLPHSFLLGANASAVRTELVKNCWIRVLVDLSAISVFGDTGIYVILLVFQRKLPNAPEPPAMIVRVAEQPGRALQAALDGQRLEGKSFSVYDVEQAEFAPHAGGWSLLPPSESKLARKLSMCPTLSQFLEVRQGIVTGADDVFVISTAAVPQGEEVLFMPFLHDRDMEPYSVPAHSALHVFHPFNNGERLTEEVLSRDFPNTWKYLLSHRAKLQARKSFARYGKTWWEPMWPRAESIQRSKLLAPHLVLMPRFSLDLEGRFAISRGPILLPVSAGAGEEELLKYFCAVLNSTACYWHISRHSHTYRRGYVMLEPKTLRETPVPDLAKVSSPVLKRLLRLVDARIAAKTRRDAAPVEREIDEMVSDLYGLSSEDRKIVGAD